MSAPTPDSIGQQVNSDLDNPNTPGLNAFSGAWRALTDFCGDWASNNQLQFQAYSDLINSYGNWQNPNH